MGIFEFGRNVGAKLLGRDDAAAATDARNRDLIFGNKLLRHVTGFGLEVADLKIAFADGVATVHGKAKDQATRERVVRSAQVPPHHSRPAVSAKVQVDAPEVISENPAARAHASRRRPASGSAPLARATAWYSSSQRSRRGSSGYQVMVA